MIVAGDEADGRRDILAARLRAQHRWHQPFQQERGRGRVAVVNLVAHVQGLRHQRLELDAAGLGQRQLERLAQDARHPLQPIDDLGVVGAKPQHLAEPFVEIAEGQRPLAASRTIHTGIEGLMTPAIGPTAP